MPLLGVVGPNRQRIALRPSPLSGAQSSCSVRDHPAGTWTVVVLVAIQSSNRCRRTSRRTETLTDRKVLGSHQSSGWAARARAPLVSIHPQANTTVAAHTTILTRISAPPGHRGHRTTSGPAIVTTSMHQDGPDNTDYRRDNEVLDRQPCSPAALRHRLRQAQRHSEPERLLLPPGNTEACNLLFRR
jgi:hypothetical protein